ncbi:hypothetical protein GW17_00039298, partial [Ensete ventricosum]
SFGGPGKGSSEALNPHQFAVKTPENRSPKSHPKQPQTAPKYRSLRSTNLSATQSPLSLQLQHASFAAQRCQQRPLTVIYLDRSQQRSLRQKATSSGLSLQPVHIAARNNRSLPTILIATSSKFEHDSSHLSLHTDAAILRNSRAHRCPIFLLLQPHPCCNRRHLQLQSRTAAAADIAAALFFLRHHCCLPIRSLGCHLPTNISHLKNRNLDNIAAPTLQHHRRTAADVAATIFFLHLRCYPWLPSSTWRLHHRSPDIAVICCLQPENCIYTLQSVDLTGWRSLRHDIGGLIRSQIGGYRDAKLKRDSRTLLRQPSPSRDIKRSD